MSNLVCNPDCKDYFKAKSCVAISMRYNYAGSFRSYRFKYLSFRTWSSSYCAAFCYVLGNLQRFLLKRNELSVLPETKNILYFEDILLLFCDGGFYGVFNTIFSDVTSYFSFYSISQTPAEKLSFVYKLLEGLIKYNLGLIRYDLVSPKFEAKSAIRYAASKYFPNTPFIEIESDFMFRNVMD